MASGKVFNGADWEDVVISDRAGGGGGDPKPLPPILNGNDEIFVSIPSFRDGERCGKTLVEIFTKAKDPSKVVVGIIEQNYEDDVMCIESYCKEMGVDKIYRRQSIRKDTTKIIAKPVKAECPHIDRIRKLSIHNVAAKGPVYARSMTRKLLGNEEFCLQIDAHSKFIPNWDDIIKHEWAATKNEFGIISTVPPSVNDYDSKDIQHEVPRHCLVQFAEIGIPHYPPRGDGKVQDLSQPLLAHSWSAGFSFSKCHLEESAPYDPFTPYVMGVEQFARYARFWTRGYDVYTPTQNIVYHNYQENPDGHGTMEWMKQRRERFRQQSLRRIKSYLQLPTGGGNDGHQEEQVDENLSNLGIYGLGKRRTLKQMADFIGITMETQASRPSSMSCGNDQWVPYDMNISPVDNLFDKPNDLDPQPEYPLRTKMVFYEGEDWKPLQLDGGGADPIAVGDEQRNHESMPKGLPPSVEASRYPSGILIFLLWILGLVMWCAYFVVGVAGSTGKKKPRRNKATSVKEV